MIAALTGFSNEHNSNESIRLTPTEASWLGNESFLMIRINFLKNVSTKNN